VLGTICPVSCVTRVVRPGAARRFGTKLHAIFTFRLRFYQELVTANLLWSVFAAQCALEFYRIRGGRGSHEMSRHAQSLVRNGAMRRNMYSGLVSEFGGTAHPVGVTSLRMVSRER